MRLNYVFVTCIIFVITSGIAQTPDTVYLDCHSSKYRCDTITLDEVLPISKRFNKLLDEYIRDFSQFEDYKNSTAIMTDIEDGCATSVDFSLRTSYTEYELCSPKHLLYGCFMYKDKLVIVYEWRYFPASTALLFRYSGKKYQFIYNPEEPVEDDTIYPGKCWVYRYVDGKFRQLKYDNKQQRYN